MWVLDAAGQGGSERFPGPVDLGRSNGFGVDAAALAGLLTQVVRPSAGRPVVVAASGSSALTALLAAEHGRTPLDGLFLWDPALAPPAHAAHAAVMTRWRLGGLRADGGSGVDPADAGPERSGDPARGLAARRPGPAHGRAGLGVDRRRDGSAARGARPRRRKGLRTPILVQAAQAARADRLCAGVPRCQVLEAPREPLPRHLAADAVRDAWLAALVGLRRSPHR